MTDIVERLRKREMRAEIGQHKPEIYRDAANEIERLRKDVKTAILGDTAELRDAKQEIEWLRAENDLMRKYIMSDLLDESIRTAKAELEKNDD